MLFGTTQYNPPSRFLEEIPAELVRSEGATGGSEFGAWSGRSVRSFGSYDPDVPFRADPAAGRARIAEESLLRARQPEPPSTPATTLGLRVGDDVRHPKFGEGVIVGIEGAGDKAVATVRFPGAGERQLLLSWAPLEKL
jgi:DNA helicase-2/ATP-dependent DNA helicase PcrA